MSVALQRNTVCWRRERGLPFLGVLVVFMLIGLSVGERPAVASVSVNAGTNVANVLHVVPDNALGLHTSVYANQFTNSSLDDRLIEAGTQMLRYSGGNYASIYHFSVPPTLPYYSTTVSQIDQTKPHPLTPDKGADPAVQGSLGYYASGSTFPNFINLLDASNTNAMITVNYGSSLGNFDATAGKWLSKKGGQPQEAAAWVAYSNSDPSIYGTPNDVVLGVDAEGIDWKTAGYWAKLRASTQPEYQDWAMADGKFDAANAFLAVNHDTPVGIKYWEIGNEINGNGYYGGGTGWEQDLHGAYDGSRQNDPNLSPTTYANNLIQFANQMKAVDPTIKIGGVLVGPGGVGDTGNPATDWDRNVLTTAGNSMDFGIVHWYVNNDADFSGLSQATLEANILNTVSNDLIHVDPNPAPPDQSYIATKSLLNVYAGLRSRVDQYTSHDPNDFEIHMTEFGYFDTVGNTNVVTGLFTADVYATALEEGADSVHFLEMSAAPFLSDSGGLTRGPAFRAFQMLDKFFNSGDEVIDTTSSSSNVKVHAVRQADGTVAVMLINELAGAGNDANVTITIDGTTLADMGIQWLYGSTGTGAPVQSSVGGLGNSFTYNIAPRMLALLLIPPAPNLPGDFNGDHVVDAADYTTWRNGLDSTYTLADYDVWKSHFGESQPGGGSAATASAPEPSALVLICVSLLAALPMRRRAEFHQIGSFGRA